MPTPSPIALTAADLKAALNTTATAGNLGADLSTATFRVNSMRGSQFTGLTVTICGIPAPTRYPERNDILRRVARYVHNRVVAAHPRTYIDVRADGWPAGHSIGWRTDQPVPGTDQN